PVMDIHDLHKMAVELAGKPEALEAGDEVVAVIEYRDGSVIDVVRKPKQ
ncbi:hypothetical protein JZU71_01570, partial [bacterium]|nr:hypothetical protein [bacterium]